MTTRFLAALVLAAALAGCGATTPPVPPSGATATNSTGIGSDVYRVIDREAGVVCYGSLHGLQCMPIKDTALDK